MNNQEFQDLLNWWKTDLGLRLWLIAAELGESTRILTRTSQRSATITVKNGTREEIEMDIIRLMIHLTLPQDFSHAQIAGSIEALAESMHRLKHQTI